MNTNRIQRLYYMLSHTKAAATHRPGFSIVKSFLCSQNKTLSRTEDRNAKISLLYHWSHKDSLSNSPTNSHLATIKCHSGISLPSLVSDEDNNSYVFLMIKKTWLQSSF